MLRKAATASEKNMTPKREAARSNAAAGSVAVCASACSKRTFGASVRSRAAASSGSEMSRPSTAPPGLTSRASARVEPPAPQPMSSTDSPGAAAQAASRSAVASACIASSSVSNRIQFRPASAFQ